MLWLAYSVVTGEGWVWPTEAEAWAFIERHRNGWTGKEWSGTNARVVPIA